MKMPISLDRWVCKELPTQVIGDCLTIRRNQVQKSTTPRWVPGHSAQWEKPGTEGQKTGFLYPLCPPWLILGRSRDGQWVTGHQGRGRKGVLVLSFSLADRKLRKQRLSCVVNVTNGKVLTQDADAGELLRVWIQGQSGLYTENLFQKGRGRNVSFLERGLKWQVLCFV